MKSSIIISSEFEYFSNIIKKKKVYKQSVSALETSSNFPLGFHHLVWLIQSQSSFSLCLSLSLSGFSQWMQMFAPLQIGAWRRQLSIVSAKHIPIIFSH